MNNTDLHFNGLTAPNQAVEELLGEQFIEWLLNFVAGEVKNWPQIQAITAASPKIERIRKFMLQCFLAAEAFLGNASGEPGFLGFALANLSESADPLAESALEIIEKKKNEEYLAHRALWIKLLHGLEVSDEEIKHAEPKEPTRHYVAELSDVYSNSEWQTAVGAFAAHERSLPEEYSAISQMLRRNSQITDGDLEILTSKQTTDYKVLDKIVFDQESKQLVWEGARRQLTARREFYKGLMKYLEN